jgi:hypothetical protein
VPAGLHTDASLPNTNFSNTGSELPPLVPLLPPVPTNVPLPDSPWSPTGSDGSEGLKEILNDRDHYFPKSSVPGGLPTDLPNRLAPCSWDTVGPSFDDFETPKASTSQLPAIPGSFDSLTPIGFGFLLSNLSKNNFINNNNPQGTNAIISLDSSRLPTLLEIELDEIIFKIRNWLLIQELSKEDAEMFICLIKEWLETQILIKQLQFKKEQSQDLINQVFNYEDLEYFTCLTPKESLSNKS